MSGGGSSGLGSTGSFFNWLDPGNIFGHSSSSVGGNILDPGNIFGGNPQASSNPRLTGYDASGGMPSVLPNLGAASMVPHLYDPNSFVNPTLTGGLYNKMAKRAAGPVYMPRLLPGMSYPGVGGGIYSGGGGASSGGYGDGGGPASQIPPSYSNPGQPSSPNYNPVQNNASGQGSYDFGTNNPGYWNAFNPAIYGPTTINSGGQTITGDTSTGGGFSVSPGMGAFIGGAALGLPGALAGGQLAKWFGGSGNQFSGDGIKGYTGPATFNGAKNVQPTNVTIPKTKTVVPAPIIDPTTGAPYGTPYYSSPVGQMAAFHQAIANGQMESEAANSLFNKNNAGRNTRA